MEWGLLILAFAGWGVAAIFAWAWWDCDRDRRKALDGWRETLDEYRRLIEAITQVLGGPRDAS